MNKIQILGYLGWLKVEREEMEKEGRKERGERDREKKWEARRDLWNFYTNAIYYIYTNKILRGTKRRESCELNFFFPFQFLRCSIGLSTTGRRKLELGVAAQASWRRPRSPYVTVRIWNQSELHVGDRRPSQKTKTKKYKVELLRSEKSLVHVADFYTWKGKRLRSLGDL